MALAHALTGLDHVVITVDALEKAARLWGALGFTVAPRGDHSAVMGTSNHTIMLEHDYLELLVVREPTPANQDWRDAHALTGEGLHGIALGTSSASATQAAFDASGIQAKPVIDFQRPVARESGEAMLAKFRVTSCPKGTVTGLKLFVCEHLTREAVWLPELVRHDNTARAITGLDMAVPDVAEAARGWARALGEAAVTRTGEAMTVMIGRHRLALSPGAGAPPRVTALHVAVADIGACRDVLGARAEAEGQALIARGVNGIDLVFAAG